METEKLYYQDPYLQTFSARVLSCEPARGGFAVVLDRTAFYPEGGGQPADHGTLNGVPVTDVHERDGVIFHTCGSPLEAGAAVEGAIDWARRFDHMQQHSGEHVCSGLICTRYHCDNVGFHLGADLVTIDFNADIPWEELLEVEAAANRCLWEDRPVDIRFCRGAELEALDYRSKKALEGDVRIVTFPGADCCACCGTHVRRTGEIGLVKFLSCQRFREGVRIELLCGGRALRHLSRTWEQNRQVAQALSAKPEHTFNAVVKLQNQLSDANFRAGRLEEAAFSALAAEYRDQGDVLLFQPPMSPDSVRRLADAVAGVSGGLAAVFAGEGDRGRVCRYHYALVRSDGADIAPLVKSMNGALHGKGGGRGGFAQGSVETRREEIELFFQKGGL